MESNGKMGIELGGLLGDSCIRGARGLVCTRHFYVFWPFMFVYYFTRGDLSE